MRHAKAALLFIFTLVFVAGCGQPESANFGKAKGVIEARNGLFYDFGEIDINGGVVSKDFQFKNTDSIPLTIYEATTSCGCTTGKIFINEKIYDSFGMHQPLKQAIAVPSGADFVVTVFYDPLFHGPADLGKRQRTVFIFSSAEVDGKIVRSYSGKPNFTEIGIAGEVVTNPR